jgi:hypothetical protein
MKLLFEIDLMPSVDNHPSSLITFSLRQAKLQLGSQTKNTQTEVVG